MGTLALVYGCEEIVVASGVIDSCVTTASSTVCQLLLATTLDFPLSPGGCASFKYTHATYNGQVLWAANPLTITLVTEQALTILGVSASYQTSPTLNTQAMACFCQDGGGGCQNADQDQCALLNLPPQTPQVSQWFETDDFHCAFHDFFCGCLYSVAYGNLYSVGALTETDYSFNFSLSLTGDHVLHESFGTTLTEESFSYSDGDYNITVDFAGVFQMPATGLEGKYLAYSPGQPPLALESANDVGEYNVLVPGWYQYYQGTWDYDLTTYDVNDYIINPSCTDPVGYWMGAVDFQDEIEQPFNLLTNRISGDYVLNSVTEDPLTANMLLESAISAQFSIKGNAAGVVYYTSLAVAEVTSAGGVSVCESDIGNYWVAGGNTGSAGIVAIHMLVNGVDTVMSTVVLQPGSFNTSFGFRGVFHPSAQVCVFSTVVSCVWGTFSCAHDVPIQTTNGVERNGTFDGSSSSGSGICWSCIWNWFDNPLHILEIVMGIVGFVVLCVVVICLFKCCTSATMKGFSALSKTS